MRRSTPRLQPSKGWPHPLAPYAAALLAVVVATVLSLSLQRYLHFEVLIGVFLAAIMVVATTAGRRPAILAGVVGWASYNYLVEEPRYVLQLRSVQDLVVAALFVTVGAVIGVLSDRVRAAAVRAEVHAAQLDELLQASRAFSEPTTLEALHEAICQSIAVTCRADVWLYGETGALLYATACDAAPPDFILKSGLTAPVGHTAVSPDWCARPLATGGHALGCLVWARGRPGRAEPQSDLAQVALMGDLAAAAMLRLRDAAVRSEAQALVHTEALRTALLSSISHDFRTPLSSIMASSTALVDYGPRFGEETRRDLLDNIVREAQRLDRFVGKVLDMTRIGAGAIQPRLEVLLLSEVIERSLDHVRGMAPAVPFEARLANAPTVLADPVLLETALTNVLENAARFSPAGRSVGVSVRAEDGAVLIGVSDHGPGVPEHQRELIFESFRSLEPDRQRSGLGLSIVRAFVEACGGRAWASARDDGGPGLSVWISLRPGREGA